MCVYVCVYYITLMKRREYYDLVDISSIQVRSSPVF